MRKGNKAMKKYLFMMVLTTFALACCSKNNSCQQPYFQEEIPELTTEGYNTCEAVIRYYTYRVCDGDLRNYPHWSHKGDTIKVCGYIHKSHWETGHGTLPLYDGASDNHDLLVSYVLEQLPDTLDYTRKCFIEGVLGFNPHYHSGPYDIVPVVVPYKKIVFE